MRTAHADAEDFAAWARARRVRYSHAPVVGSLVRARWVDSTYPSAALWADRSRGRYDDTAAEAATDKLVNNLSLAVAMQGFHHPSTHTTGSNPLPMDIRPTTRRLK